MLAMLFIIYDRPYEDSKKEHQSFTSFTIPHYGLQRRSKTRYRLYRRNDRALSIEDEGSDDLSQSHAYLDEVESMSECVGEKSEAILSLGRCSMVE